MSATTELSRLGSLPVPLAGDLKGFDLALPKRAVKQPVPDICPGGDCGACVVSGLTGLPLREVYEWNQRDRKEVLEALSWPTMRDVLYQLYAHHKVQHIMDSVPLFFDLRPASTWIFGSPGWTMNIGWFNWITLAIKAGYYGIVAVDSQRRGPIDGGPGDHWVMICGVRETWPKDCGMITKDVLVSNSSRTAPDEEWVDVSKFLQYWGGYNVLLVKPWEGPEFRAAS
jgi:hypothetical protein